MLQPGSGFRVVWAGGVPTVRSDLLDAAGVPHVFTTRRGAPDGAAFRSGGLDPAAVVDAEQVHGGTVVRVGRGDVGRTVPDADGLWTAEAGVTLRVRGADCPLVLVADPTCGRVAAVHAGWRGLAAGILAQAVQSLVEAGSHPGSLLCAVGPCVGPCCYEVDAPVWEALQEWPEAFSPGRPGRWQLDLRAVARAQLASAGILREGVSAAAVCTACEADWFYSYRREGRTGSQWAFVAAPRVR
jgi:YfiH family protein